MGLNSTESTEMGVDELRFVSAATAKSETGAVQQRTVAVHRRLFLPLQVTGPFHRLDVKMQITAGNKKHHYRHLKCY